MCSGEIESVASGHQAFNMAQKSVGKDDFRLIPAGVNGVAERLSVVWDRAVVSAACNLFSLLVSVFLGPQILYERSGHTVLLILARTQFGVILTDPMATRHCLAHVRHAVTCSIFIVICSTELCDKTVVGP